MGEERRKKQGKHKRPWDLPARQWEQRLRGRQTCFTQLAMIQISSEEGGAYLLGKSLKHKETQDSIPIM